MERPFQNIECWGSDLFAGFPFQRAGSADMLVCIVSFERPLKAIMQGSGLQNGFFEVLQSLRMIRALVAGSCQIVRDVVGRYLCACM